MRKLWNICWLTAFFILIDSTRESVFAQKALPRAQASLQEITEELDYDRRTWVKTYNTGVLLLHGYDEDTLSYILEKSLYKERPIIRVNTVSGPIPISTCQEFFTLRGSDRRSIDRRNVAWHHYRSCDEEAAQVKLAPTEHLRFDPLETMRELVTTLPIRSFNLPPQVLQHLRRFPANATILTLWPHGNDDSRPGLRPPYRYIERSVGKLVFSWGIMSFGISGFGDFDGDGIQDVLFDLSVSEEFRWRGDCRSSSILRVSRLEPGGPLVPHQIAHVHRQCEGRAFDRRQP